MKSRKLNTTTKQANARRLVVSQGVASIGAMLISFGIDVWFYKETGSYSSFATIAILATLPPIFISPIAGFLTDRIDRSKLLFFSELATLSLSLYIAALYLADALTFLSIACAVFLLAVAGEFRYTATTALIPDLAENEEINSINGMQQAFRGVVAILGPLLGAAGYEYLGLVPLVIASAGSAAYGSYVAYTLRAPNKNPAEAQHTLTWDFFGDYFVGFKWLKSEASLKVILIHFTFLCGLLALFRTLLVPYILDAMGTAWLGAVISAQGIGLLAGGLALARYGKLLKPEAILFRGCYGIGAFVALLGASGHPAAVILIAVGIGATISVASACNQILWQTRTPQQMQGRIIAIRSITLYALSPLTIYFSVPISNLIKRDTLHDFGLLGKIEPNMWSSTIMITIGLLILVGSLGASIIYSRSIHINQAHAEKRSK